MSDIPLIKTLITIEPITVSGTTQNTTQTPNPLSTLTNGTFVDGFVVNRNAQNQPILRTSAGDVLLNTQLFLKTGTEVTIRVDNSQPNLARIITINGQSPEIFAEHQRIHSTAGTTDSLSSQMASAVATNSSGTPKPVMLQGIMLQLMARDTLPAPMADALFKALGIDKNARTGITNNSPPLSIVLRSIAMPNATPQTPTPQITPNIAQPKASSPVAPPIPVAEAARPFSPPATAMVDSITSSPSSASATPVTKPEASGLLTKAPPPKADPSILLTQPAEAQAEKTPSVISPAVSATPKPPGNTPPALPSDTARAPIAPANTSNSAREMPQPLSTSTPPASHHMSTTRPLAAVEIKPNNTITLQGLVIGQEQNTDSILHTPIGSMRIFTPKPLPSGAVVTLDIVPSSQNTETAKPHLTPPTMQHASESVDELIRDWPSLAQLVEETQRTDAALFQSIIARALPTPGKHFTQTMLFFLSALKGGDIKQWMGSKANEMLEAKHGDIIRRMGSEFATLQQAFIEPNTQNWVSAMIPVLYDNRLHQARLHIRQDAEAQSEKTQQGGQRFIIDVELSRLGELQLDGFVQKNAGKHQFDIVLRSSKPLPSDIEQDIRAIYINASEIAGFKGNILFQPSREHFVIVQAASTIRKDSGIIA